MVPSSNMMALFASKLWTLVEHGVAYIKAHQYGAWLCASELQHLQPTPTPKAKLYNNELKSFVSWSVGSCGSLGCDGTLGIMRVGVTMAHTFLAHLLLAMMTNKEGKKEKFWEKWEGDWKKQLYQPLPQHYSFTFGERRVD